ncbi:flavin-containing monooxygenase [Rhodococcus sp. P1Y]|uniref:flavin-containing monooxygenase n=1 Tax=Rhodococcus sp. P1Y TaxID=1302308 RepID=UPI000EAC1C66|nr:NAD(P)/FAD-dependent oxidoreductase [Rhodococcus sp. P1Y]AYJ48316.1 NAD(P)/FAD-dependent oxidoreductase [Rhodococcus sp. P1Y]
MTSTTTGPTYELSGNDVTLDDVIESCNPGALLLSMVHITGDLGLVDEFEALIKAAKSDATSAVGTHYVASGSTTLPYGTYPDSVASAVRERAREILAGDLDPRLMELDEDLFKRLASLCSATEVTDEFVPILMEQAGFRLAQRVVPVTRRPPAAMDVIVVGAGMIGLNAAVKLQDAGFAFRVFEARDDIGGTWSRNTYPGAAVDTPSHYYSYSFELNPDWSRYYPSGPEYLKYMKAVVHKYDLARHIQLSTAVDGARWIEQDQQWEVVTRAADGSMETHRSRALVTALGVLSAPNVPDVPGLDTFAGDLVHSAEWRDVDLSGKRVVVLGTGCTSVQLVTNIVDEVGSLDVVVRTPHWIVPEKAVENDVPAGELWAMRYLPFYQQWFRFRAFWLASDNLYPIPRIDPEWAKDHLSVSKVNDNVMQVSLRYLQDSFSDRPDLIEKLTPDFRPYAKRIVKDPGFFAALKRDNVTLHRASFESVRPDGVVTTEGTFIPADVILLATGFTVEYATSLDIVGRDDKRLADVWRNGDDPRAYLGIQVPHFPNLFVTAGPNAAPNHGGGHNITSEEHVHYIVECLQYLVENEYESMDVGVEAMDRYNDAVDDALDKTVWAHPGKEVTGYYRNTAGRPIVPCPWRIVDYWTMLREPDPSKFSFTARASAEPSADSRSRQL